MASLVSQVQLISSKNIYFKLALVVYIGVAGRPPDKTFLGAMHDRPTGKSIDFASL
jgi:hypothetical protein